MRFLIFSILIFSPYVWADPSAQLDPSSSIDMKLLRAKLHTIEAVIAQLEEKYSIGSMSVFKQAYVIPALPEKHEVTYTRKGACCYSTCAYDKKKVTLNKFTFAKNCIISAASQIVDERGKILRVEEGPIDLTKANGIFNYAPDHSENFSWDLTFAGSQEHFPALSFQDRYHQKKTALLLAHLLTFCHQRQRLKQLLDPEPSVEEPTGELEVSESSLQGDRLVRYYADDQTLKASLLSDGTSSFAARLKLMKDAKGVGDKIRLQYLMFMADDAGLRIAEDLIRKAQNGVNIELIIDAFSPLLDLRDFVTHDNTKIMYKNFMAAGIPVYGYRCRGHHLFDQFMLGTKIHRSILNQRPHEKFWIVNDKRVILGGMNIGNDYFRLNEKGIHYWRDQDILIEGKEIIQDVINIFDANKASYVANYLDPRKDSCFNPHDPVKQGQAYQKFYLANSQQYTWRRSRNAKQEFQAHAQDTIRQIERQLDSPRAKDAFSFENLKAARIVHSRPKLSEVYIENTYLDMINHAREEILIENAYFIPSDAIKKALIRAARRGVAIKIITNSMLTNDVPPVAALSRSYYKEIVDDNFGGRGEGKPMEIMIYEWMGAKNLDGIQQQGMNHAKFIVVDRQLVFIGSYNLDPRSRNLNSEVGILFRGQNDTLARELAENFHTVDLAFSRKIPYREMISYYKPISLLKALALRMRGYRFDRGLGQLALENFYYNVARFSKESL